MRGVDCDGDTSLVVADENIITIAERNMENIVPLYYEMKKANPVILTNDELYKGMAAAWSGGNIGVISNDISKIWNSGEDIGENEKLAVKLLCMENNFVIDYAKTLYKLTRPEKINDFLRDYTRKKTPHFFVYAKDKEEKQVEKINNTTVNKLERLIKNKRLSFKHMMDFDYKILMNNPDIEICEKTIDSFKKIQKRYRFDICDNEDGNNISYIKKITKEVIQSRNFTDVEIADILVKYLYSGINTSYKKLLWIAYGDILLENIKQNTKDLDSYCIKCGKRFKPRNHSHKYCDECSSDKGFLKIRRITCVDCGTEFTVKSTVRNKKRCDNCQEKANKVGHILRMKKYRNS